MDLEQIENLIKDSIPDYFEATEQEIKKLSRTIKFKYLETNEKDIKELYLCNLKRDTNVGLTCDITIDYYEPTILHYFDEKSKRLKPYAIQH